MVTTQIEGASDNCWYLDIGCSTHMTGRREWFLNLDQSVKSQVKFADDRTLSAKGIGKVLIKTKDRGQSCITDVLFVPGMKSNLLSLSQLLEKGFMTKLENKMLRVFERNHKLILKSPLSKIEHLKLILCVDP